MTTVVSNDEQEPNNDDAAGHQQFIIPRTAMPMVVRRYHHRDYRPLLALPPSTNCPASFEEMYRFATAVDWSAGGGGGRRGGRGVVQQRRKTRQDENDNGRGCSTDDDSDSSSPVLLLQEDVMPQILSYCDAITLSRASRVCRSWHVLANADDLWTGLCKEVFGILPYELRPPPDPTRVLYILSYLKLRETLSFGRGGGGGGMSSRRSINGIPTIFRVG